MSNVFDWDFTKLPDDQHERVAQLIETNKWRELIEIHNFYQLSIMEYCCDISGVQQHYLHALETGKIKRDVQK